MTFRSEPTSPGPRPGPHEDPHRDTPVLSLGPEVQNAASALILLHGRGAMAADMLGLAGAFVLPADMRVLAPQAGGSVWYPQRFLAPLQENEPFLSSALRRITAEIEQLEHGGVPAEKIILGGFSQGACLALEYVLRSPRRWGGVMAFSGGYIGPIGTVREPTGAGLEGAPVFLGCSDVDPHIPLTRVKETVGLLQAMGARVTLQIYPGIGHTVVMDEIDQAQKIISGLE